MGAATNLEVHFSSDVEEPDDYRDGLAKLALAQAEEAEFLREDGEWQKLPRDCEEFLEETEWLVALTRSAEQKGRREAEGKLHGCISRLF